MKELIISLSSCKKRGQCVLLEKHVPRQEQMYRGFIKGNAHGINGGESEGLDSSQTMMHSNPE